MSVGRSPDRRTGELAERPDIEAFEHLLQVGDCPYLGELQKLVTYVRRVEAVLAERDAQLERLFDVLCEARPYVFNRTQAVGHDTGWREETAVGVLARVVFIGGPAWFLGAPAWVVFLIFAAALVGLWRWASW